MKELENQPKYAVIDFCTALELFLKARLLKEHWDSAPNRYLVGPPTAADICRRPPVWLPRMSHSDQQNTWPSCRAGRRRARSHLEITTERATVSGIRSLEAVDQGRGFPVVPRPSLRPHCRRSFSGSAGLATGVGLEQLRSLQVQPGWFEFFRSSKSMQTTSIDFPGFPLTWPTGKTEHRLICGDARDLSFIADSSVHLVATSPPYWTLKQYQPHPDQMGHIENYEIFIEELNKVWRHCYRVLVPGGRLVCVVGDVCLSRREQGRHLVMPPARRHHRGLSEGRFRQPQPDNLAEDFECDVRGQQVQQIPR